MCATFSERRQDTQTCRAVVYVHYLTKHTWQLFNGHLVTVWIEQNQVFWHENANDIATVSIVDRDTAVALSVDLLSDFTIDDRINV